MGHWVVVHFPATGASAVVVATGPPVGETDELCLSPFSIFRNLFGNDILVGGGVVGGYVGVMAIAWAWNFIVRSSLHSFSLFVEENY